MKKIVAFITEFVNALDDVISQQKSDKRLSNSRFALWKLEKIIYSHSIVRREALINALVGLYSVSQYWTGIYRCNIPRGSPEYPRCIFVVGSVPIQTLRPPLQAWVLSLWQQTRIQPACTLCLDFEHPFCSAWNCPTPYLPFPLFL